MFKNQKGITLIALVITIIVLLILAGITIALITSNESAPNKAGEAKVMQDVGEAKDQISVNSTTMITTYYENKFVKTGSAQDVTTNNAYEYITAAANTTVPSTSANGTGLFANVNKSKVEITTTFAATTGDKNTFTVRSKETNSTGKHFQVEGTVDVNGGISWVNSGTDGWVD